MTAVIPLYRQAMGRAFERLSPELQAFHSAGGRNRFFGRCAVTGPENFFGRLIARVCGLPEASYDGDFSFELESTVSSEKWRRKFRGRDMLSTMRVVDGVLVEQLGPLELRFGLQVDEGRLVMHLGSIIWKGIQIPRFLHPSVVAEETGASERLHFNVAATLPLFGHLVAYKGHLAISALMPKSAKQAGVTP
jgi:hypothetical protein